MSIFQLDLQFFAQKKGGGSAATNCNHDSTSKRLGVKKFGGERVNGGGIIVRQNGSKYRVKKNDKSVFMSKNYTVHAGWDGIVKYYYLWKRGKKRTFVSVLPLSK